MLLVKGDHVALHLDTGQLVVVDPSYGLLHDESGADVERCVLHIGPHRLTGRQLPAPRDAIAYFGSAYVLRESEVRLPSGPWHPAGTLLQILYRRPRGSLYGGKFFHVFRKHTRVTFARNARFIRIHLGTSCVVNWRGIVAP